MSKVIAVDGYSSTGKSTLAKALAKRLNFTYIDTGAMYRAVTLFALRENCFEAMDLKACLTPKLSQVSIGFEKKEQGQEVTLNGENIEAEIRGMRVSSRVSEVAALSEVRRFLVDQQRIMGASGQGVVMDGRDIGSVVFPDAFLKIFVTADPEIRAKRRFEELQGKGEIISLEDVKTNLAQRDHLDTSREDSPLIQTEDARVLDNTHLTRQEQEDLAYSWAQELL